MKLWRWVLAGLLALQACGVVGSTTIHGVTPIYPEVSSSYPTKVDSLQPTFRWEAVIEPDVRYDFIVYERRQIETLGPYKTRGVFHFSSFFMAIGREVYYREGLEKPEHRVEVPLRPTMLYFWSIRVRRGEDVSEWSRFDARIPEGGCEPFASSKEEFPFFMFSTLEK
jgi:hypothetical protein